MSSDATLGLSEAALFHQKALRLLAVLFLPACGARKGKGFSRILFTAPEGPFFHQRASLENRQFWRRKILLSFFIRAIK
jgi:hypothetical protein